MNNENDRRNQPTDDPLESLFRDVPARPRPPADVEEAAWRHFRGQWADQRAAARPRKHRWYVAIAASVLFVMLLQPLYQFWRVAPSDPGSLGQVERFVGSVTVVGPDTGFALSVDQLPSQLERGQTLVSNSDSGISIRWRTGGKSLRVGQNTRLKLVSASQIELLAGQVYLDIPAASGPADDLQVTTRFGTVRHTGTQFAVAVTDSNVEVMVREGSVAIDDGLQSRTASAGVRGTLDGSGNYSTAPVESHGPAWGWVERLAPAYDIEGRSVMEFLGWVQRETGRRCVFSTPDAERLARGTLMHGPGLVMEPMAALDLVLQTNELAWESRGGDIVISIDD